MNIDIEQKDLALAFPNLVKVFGLNWTPDESGDWICDPLAFPVYCGGAKRPGSHYSKVEWRVRLGAERPHPVYDSQAEAMYWSVWHKAAAMGQAQGQIDAWAKAWLSFDWGTGKPPKEVNGAWL